MNIILLSGGSGKRLWPLSNNTRSKQFLKLLKDDKNNYESMVQRVYRQMMEANINANIVIATGKSQVDTIRNQLGNNVDIVIEPERRDTFPAIVLACAYLAYEKKIDTREPVLVLPVDPFAEIDYFKTLLKMEQAIIDDYADMVLMGIEPTYASAKYGYIISSQDSLNKDISMVKYFIEKPNEEKAEELIKLGAVWNGGVFAFRLEYIINLLSEYSIEKSFYQIKKHYSDLKKISFDYEVVEKANSVAVMLYRGYWKDLGTWNTLTEEMDDISIGNVIVGEDTVNTTIINELSIPVVVLGAKDMVVSVSPDGVLVSDKQKSSYLKPYVDKLDGRPMYEERFWGEYRVVDYEQYEDGVKSLTNHFILKAGKCMESLEHNQRDEVITIVNGTGELTIEDKSYIVKRGDVFSINKVQKRKLCAISDMHVIDVQIGEDV